MKRQKPFRFNTRKKKNNPEGGFTLIEVLFTIFLLSVLGLVIVSAIITGQRLYEKNQKAIESSFSLLQLDSFLRKYASRIIPPFWVLPDSLSFDCLPCEIPYYNGDPNKALAILFEEGMLKIKLPEEEYEPAFGPYEDVKIGPALNQEDDLVGLEVILTLKNKEEITITARFGGFPISTYEK
jgi:hypothetical protein